MNKVDDHLVVVATFLEPNQAHAVRLRLDADGVRSTLDGEHHITTDWFISNAIGGVKLFVHERDLELATKILQSSVPEILDQLTGDETEAVTSDACCPACSSHDVYRERMKRRLVIVSMLLLGFPIPFLSYKMACESCGHRWIAD